ncbi:helix-turn-helix domain-containing protein [Gemmobacter lanyuensis]
MSSGSPEEIVLKLGRASPDVIAATLAMVRRGTTMLKAKRAVEKALQEGDAVIDLPMVDDKKALADDLESAGMSVTFRSVLDRDLKENFATRLKELRIRLHMSQEEFARDYNLQKKTLQGWELGNKIPDHGNRLLISLIEKDPVTTKRLVNAG